MKKLVKKFIKNKKLPKDFEWNDGYFLEGMDRIETIRTMIEQILFKHPAIIVTNNQEAIDSIQMLLGEIYHDIGFLEVDKAVK